jgi:hypothetical protein
MDYIIIKQHESETVSETLIAKMEKSLGHAHCPSASRSIYEDPHASFVPIFPEFVKA